MSTAPQVTSELKVSMPPGTTMTVEQGHELYHIPLVLLGNKPIATGTKAVVMKPLINLPDRKAQRTTFTATRTKAVVMGQQSFLRVLLRLIYAELYKLQCRTMSKVLSITGILVMISAFSLISLGAVFVLHTSARVFLPPQCTRNFQGQGCLNHSPTQAELTQAEHVKQETLHSVSAPLRFPNSLGVAVQITRTVGLIVIIILAGTIVGGEYGIGTVRLMLTRGPTRTQFLLSKIGTIIICIVLMFLVMVLIGILIGSLLNLMTGIATNFNFLTAAWTFHAVLYMLVAMLGLFLYAMMAFFLATLGRATTAGIAGGLAWSFFESVIGGALSLISSLTKGSAGDFLKSVPDYFIGNNIAALLQNQSKYILGQPPSTLSDLHALLVLGGYSALFIGLALWVNKRRDVTN